MLECSIARVYWETHAMLSQVSQVSQLSQGLSKWDTWDSLGQCGTVLGAGDISKKTSATPVSWHCGRIWFMLFQSSVAYFTILWPSLLK